MGTIFRHILPSYLVFNALEESLTISLKLSDENVFEFIDMKEMNVNSVKDKKNYK